MIYIYRQFLEDENSQLFNYSKCFKKKNYDVTIFCSNFSHKRKNNIIPSDNLYNLKQINGVNLVYIKSFFKYKKNHSIKRILNLIEFSILSFFVTLYLVKKLKKKPIIILISVSHNLNLITGYFLSKIFNCKFWIEISEQWPEVLIYLKLIKPTNLLIPILEKINHIFYKKANFISVINKNIKNLLVNKYKVKKINIEIFIPGFNKKKISKNSYIKKKIFTFIYGGSLNKSYPLDQLIKSFHTIKDKNNKQIFIIGDGELKERLISLTQKLKLNKYVFFFDFMKRLDYIKFLKKSDTLIVIENSVKYGFPSKLLDYFHFNKPILLFTNYKYKNLEDLIVQQNIRIKKNSKILSKYSSLSDREIYNLGKEITNYAKSNFDTFDQFKKKILNRI